MTRRELAVVTGLVELDQASLRERAMKMLRDEVTSGEIEPGTRLVETELSAAMSISQGTLREAVRQLEYDGLLEVGKRGRLTVPLAAAQLADMFLVRGALEGLAAATISGRPDRGALVSRLQVAQQDLATANGSISDLVEADLAFHRLLCGITGNAPLVRAWETLTGPIRLAILFAGPATAVTTMSASRHQLLVDGIASGDPGTARSAVDAHMRQAAHALLASQQDSDTPGQASGQAWGPAAIPSTVNG